MRNPELIFAAVVVLALGCKEREIETSTTTAGVAVATKTPQASIISPSAAPRLFVTNERSGTITVVDTSTDQVIDTIAVGARPRGITFSGNGERLFAALTDLPGRSGKITPGRRGIAEIDLSTGEVLAMFDGGSDPETVASNHDGNRLYISNEDAGTATVVDTTTGRSVATHIVGIEPEGVTISPDGKWVYVTAETSNTVSVIDTAAEKVVASFFVGSRPRAATFSSDSRWAWVTGEIDGNVSYVDVSKHEVIDEVDLPSPSKPVGVVISPDGKAAYVAAGHANAVARIDTASRKLQSMIPVGRRPWNVAITPDGAKLYAANGLSNDISVVDVETEKVIRTIPAGDGPWGAVIGR